MSFRLSVGAQNSSANAIVARVDAGTTNPAGAINIYTGSQPATPATGATGTLLVSIPLNNPSFSTASGGASTLITTTPVKGTVAATGDAGWFRFVDRDGNAVVDGSITATGGGGDITLDQIHFLAGGTVVVNSLSFQQPM